MPSYVEERPNIVFFMVDQLSAKWLEAASDGICPTPNIDRLRQRGVTFTNAISSNPVCMPTRSTMATGLTTRGHGVLENGYELDPALPTFMHALQRGGWRTGAFGKVHLHPHYAGVYPDYQPYGFDVTHITEDARGGEWLDWVEREHPQHYDAVLSTIWATQIADFAAYGPHKIDLRPRIEAAKARMLPPAAEMSSTRRLAYTLPFPEQVSQTAWITGRGVEFLRQTPLNQPLYAHISYVQPHSPFCPPAEYMKYVNLDRIPAPVPPEWTKDPHAPGYFRDTKGHFRAKGPVDIDWRTARHHYFADIVHLDHQLGRILNVLEETERLNNTYVIFLSDHGEMFCDHGFLGKEERHYDACIRVPLIIAGPGLQPGLICEELVQHEDICPTVLEMASIAAPPLPKMGPHLMKAEPEDIPSLPGRSLLGLCHGEKPDRWRQAAYSESYNAIWSVTPGDWARTIRTKEFRYTYYAHGNGEQMFDLRTDPDEQRNLVADPSYSSVRQDLRDQLLELVVMQDYPKTRRELFALGVH
jgi:arylsulfatase